MQISGMMGDLEDPHTAVTFFAPTNAAVERLASQMKFDSVLAALGDADMWTLILGHHFTASVLSSNKLGVGDQALLPTFTTMELVSEGSATALQNRHTYRWQTALRLLVLYLTLIQI